MVVLLLAVMVAIAIKPGKKSTGDTALRGNRPRLSSESNEEAVLSNDRFRLSVSTDGELSVTDAKNGFTIGSRSAYAAKDTVGFAPVVMLMRSELVLDYYMFSDALTSNISQRAYSNEATVAIQSDENEIRVQYDFQNIAICLDVCYSLSDSYFSAGIDLGSIDEYGENGLLSVTLLPALFAGSGEEDGGILVPDGSGAWIRFHNGAEQEYNAPVYGEELAADNSMKRSNNRTIRLPVFGIQKEDGSVFAVIDSGDTVAEISAASRNARHDYNYVNSTVRIRSTYEKSMFTANDKTSSTAYAKNIMITGMERYSVRYYPLEKDAGYVEMAAVYRDYLQKEKGLTTQVKEPVLNVDLIGAIDVKANLAGVTYYKPRALTKYRTAQEILEELEKRGIDQIGVRYIGWNNNGVTNENVLKSLSPMGELGGKGDLKKLNAYAEEQKITVTYDVEPLRFYSGSNKYKISSPFNERLSFSRYLRSVYAKDIAKRSWFLLSAKQLNQTMPSVFKSAQSLDLKNLSLSSLTNVVYSDFNAKSVVTAGEMAETVSDLLREQSAFVISGEDANAYTIPYLSKIYAAPSYTSGFEVFDEEIPFYQIALHGVVDMTAESQFISDDREINFLKAVEVGSQLLYTGIGVSTEEIVDTDYDYLYGTDYTLWAQDAADRYQRYQKLLEKVYDSVIVAHRALQPDVFETEYENGVRVIVNYNDYEVNVDGIRIGKTDYTERGVS